MNLTDTQIEDGTWHSVMTEPLFTIIRGIIMDISTIRDTTLKMFFTDMTDTTRTKIE